MINVWIRFSKTEYSLIFQDFDDLFCVFMNAFIESMNEDKFSYIIQLNKLTFVGNYNAKNFNCKDFLAFIRLKYKKAALLRNVYINVDLKNNVVRFYKQKNTLDSRIRTNVFLLRDISFYSLQRLFDILQYTAWEFEYSDKNFHHFFNMPTKAIFNKLVNDIHPKNSMAMRLSALNGIRILLQKKYTVDKDECYAILYLCRPGEAASIRNRALKLLKFLPYNVTLSIGTDMIKRYNKAIADFADELQIIKIENDIENII